MWANLLIVQVFEKKKKKKKKKEKTWNDKHGILWRLKADKEGCRYWIFWLFDWFWEIWGEFGEVILTSSRQQTPSVIMAITIWKIIIIN